MIVVETILNDTELRNLYIERRSRMDFEGNKKMGGKRTVNKKFSPRGKRTKKKKKSQ